MRIPVIKKNEKSNELGFLPATDEFMDLIFAKATGYYEKFTINFKLMNKRIGKTRKKGLYALSHVINVRRQILNSPFVKIMERHSPWVYEIKILPLDNKVQKSGESDKKMNSEDATGKGETKDSETDLEILSEDAGIDQQQLIYAEQKCRSVDVLFQKKDLWKIAKYPKELINKAIDYYRCVRERTHIPSPTGWLICCLKKKYYLSYKPEKFVSSAEQTLFELEDWFIENFGSVPKRTESEFWRRTSAPSQ